MRIITRHLTRLAGLNLANAAVFAAAALYVRTTYKLEELRAAAGNGLNMLLQRFEDAI